MNRQLPLLIILIVLLVAAGAGFWFYRTSRPETPSTAMPAATVAPPPANGSAPRSVVTIEEYGDYQCPPCGMLHPELTKLKQEYGERIRFVFHHFPLTQIHKNAQAAALAAVAAGYQGRFWEMHNLLYENQPGWSEAPDLLPIVSNFARQLGLDIDRFVDDMGSARAAAVVASDFQQGIARGVNATPTLIINGQIIPTENMAPDKLRQEINRQLGAR